MSSKASVNPFFAPNQISGCQLWLDAADPNGNGLKPSYGSSVTTWVDKSGSGLNATTVGSAPTYQLNNGYPSVDFNNQSLATGTIPSDKLDTTGITYFVVVTLIDLVTLSPQIVFTTFSPEKTIRYDQLYCSYTINNGVIRGLQNNYSNGIRSFVDTASSFNAYVNGTNAFSSSTTVTYQPQTTATYYKLGNWSSGSYYFRGYINEVLVYNFALSTAQRQQVEGYLAWKWGLQSSLPANHPFKNSIIPPLLNPPTSLPVLRQNASLNYITPSQIPGLNLWLDGSDSSTLSLSGSSVTQWRDKSSTGLILNQGASAPTLGPSLNGLQTIQFTTAQSLASSGNLLTNAAQTWFTVFNAYNNANNNRFWLNHSSNIGVTGGEYFFGGNGTIWANIKSGNLSSQRAIYDNVGLGTTPFNSGQWYITNIVDSNTTTDINSYMFRINGASRAISIFSTNSNIISGTANINVFINTQSVAQAANVYISEILFYNTALTFLQIQQVEGYLAWKWGLQTSLPVSHPYKLGLPMPPSLGTIAISKASFTNWQPNQISGLTLWLDAADTTTFTLSGTNITQWRDKSGNGYNGTNNGTVVLSNFNSRSMVYFAGNSAIQGSYINSGTTISCFSVFVPQGTIDNTRVFSLTRTSGVLDYTETASLGAIVLDVGGSTAYTQRNFAGLYTTATYTLNSTNMTSVIYDGTNRYIWSQGQGQASGASSGSFNITLYGIGSYAGFNPSSVLNKLTGYVGEIISFNSALSTPQRQNVEGYLAWKWGLQNSLPATHPYAKWPPSP